MQRKVIDQPFSGLRFGYVTSHLNPKFSLVTPFCLHQSFHEELKAQDHVRTHGSLAAFLKFRKYLPLDDPSELGYVLNKLVGPVISVTVTDTIPNANCFRQRRLSALESGFGLSARAKPNSPKVRSYFLSCQLLIKDLNIEIAWSIVSLLLRAVAAIENFNLLGSCCTSDCFVKLLLGTASSPYPDRNDE